MEIFGGFMVMMSIIGLFLAVVWLIMPFVVFSIKGKQDRMLEVLEAMEKRLESLEALLSTDKPERDAEGSSTSALFSADRRFLSRLKMQQHWPNRRKRKRSGSGNSARSVENWRI